LLLLFIYSYWQF